VADHAFISRVAAAGGFSFEVDVLPQPFSAPTLIVAGRQDSTVGYAGAVDLLDRYPRATLAVVDGAGHALPHEQPEVLYALIAEWLARTARHEQARR
jgi:pimeloyl-ACP methyl ester carboxylesterase